MGLDEDIRKTLIKAQIRENDIKDLTRVFKDYLRQGMSFNQALIGIIEIYKGPVNQKKV